MRSANLQTTRHFYEFGPFRVDATERLLYRDASAIPLTPKAFETLLALVENPGRILEKDDLMQQVWPDTVVEENNLTQNISALRKLLGQNPDERSYIETIPRRGYRFVATVRERWENVPELIVRERTKSTVIIEEHEETDTRTGLLAGLSASQWLAAGAVLALVTGYGIYRVQRGRTNRENAGSAFATSGLRSRPAVAVLGLRNLTGRPDAAWLSIALSEMLTSELASGDQLRAVPGENIARMKMELPLGDADSLAGDTLAKIRTNLGTDYVVLGSYTDLSTDGTGRIRVDLRLQDARAGVTLAAFGETGTEGNLFDLVSHAGSRLRETLGLGDVPGSDAATVRAALPSNPQVAKLYADGLAEMRVLDEVRARDFLEKVVAEDPRFPLAHAALAGVWSQLGYDAKARDEAKHAFDLSGNLSREQRLWIEGRYREISNEWGQAADVYRTLFGLFPDNLDYGIRLATAQTMARKYPDALATVDALRELPPPTRDAPQIDLAEAYWAEARSDFKREQAAASRAADRGQVLGARLLVARAELAEGIALWKLGQLDEALAEVGAAQRMFAATGDRGNAADALHTEAEVLADQGQVASARQKYQEALAIQRVTGDQAGLAASLNDLALLLWMQSDVTGARQMFEQALAGFREIGDERGAANALNNLGNILYGQGEIETAGRMYEDSAAKFEKIGDKEGSAQELTNIGLVLASQGNLAEARKKYEEALAICRELGTKSQSAAVLLGLGEVAAAEGDLAGAEKWHEQALGLRRELGEKGTVAESELELATLAIEQDRPAQAEGMVGPALDEFRREGEIDDEAYGEAVLARALLAQGKLADAQRAGKSAQILAGKSADRVARLAAGITSARVEGAFADPQRLQEAARSLAASRAEAEKLGFLNYQFEARLALGEIELKSGQKSAGRTDLAGLEKEARGKGFALIARKAASALN